MRPLRNFCKLSVICKKHIKKFSTFPNTPTLLNNKSGSSNYLPQNETALSMYGLVTFIQSLVYSLWALVADIWRILKVKLNLT